MIRYRGRGNGGRRSYHGPSDSGGYPGQIVNAGEQHQTGHHGMDRRMMEINAATQYDQAPDEIRRELYLLLLEVVHSDSLEDFSRIAERRFASAIRDHHLQGPRGNAYGSSGRGGPSTPGGGYQ